MNPVGLPINDLDILASMLLLPVMAKSSNSVSISVSAGISHHLPQEGFPGRRHPSKLPEWSHRRPRHAVALPRRLLLLSVQGTLARGLLSRANPFRLWVFRCGG